MMRLIDCCGSGEYQLAKCGRTEWEEKQFQQRIEVAPKVSIQSRARATPMRKARALSRLISEDKAVHSSCLYSCENMNM